MTYKVVIARYSEMEPLLELINHRLVNKNYILYNKGDKLGVSNEISLPNVPRYTREGDCYLTYIIDHYDKLPDYVFFTQADPFDHSPDFLKILEKVIEEKPYLLKPFLPLTFGWDVNHGVPPKNVLNNHTFAYIDNYPVHIEYLNDCFEVPHLKDHGLDMCLYGFRDYYNVRKEDTLRFIYGKFRLQKPYVSHIYFHYAGIFGVSKENILKRKKEYYIYLRDLLKEIPANGYVLERLWMAIFS